MSNTLGIDIAPADPTHGPLCPKCRIRTRLIGVEPHPTRRNMDLRTYTCVVCEQTQVAFVSVEN